ncbi:MAG: protein translocase subunit SecF [bacterium]
MQGTSGTLNYRFDFLKYRYFFLVLSVALIVVSFVGYFIKGGFAYHIDFTGGVEVRVVFEKPVNVAQLRSVVTSSGWDTAQIQEVGREKKEFLVTLGGTQDERLEEMFKKAIAIGILDNEAQIKGIEWVGAEVGKDTKWNAIKAVFLALIVLLLYIAIRSELRFGVGAVLSLVHDLIIILAFLLFTGQAVSLHVLAAVLAVLGYSLNDTIIIFSRIQSNLKKYRGHSEYQIVNLSINEMLKRTLLTSGTTFCTVLAIIFLGGEILRGFALIMALGIIVGTYSSVYVASASMLALEKKKKKEEIGVVG